MLKIAKFTAYLDSFYRYLAKEKQHSSHTIYQYYYQFISHPLALVKYAQTSTIGIKCCFKNNLFQKILLLLLQVKK